MEFFNFHYLKKLPQFAHSKMLTFDSLTRRLLILVSDEYYLILKDNNYCCEDSDDEKNTARSIEYSHVYE
jgi:hypothetical protein